jgi:DNA-binding NarL/FixJ family response regulator
LLDILLPKENGITFLKKIKEIRGVSEIPIVAFSNYDEPKTKKEAFALGVKAYLIKTQYTPKEILEEIKKFL